MRVHHEGYLHFWTPLTLLPTDGYAVLSDQKLICYSHHNQESILMQWTILGFCTWNGFTPSSHIEYGLEFKSNTKNVHVSALNRKDLTEWCRALMAVMDPTSSAAQDIKREEKRKRKIKNKAKEKEKQEEAFWKSVRLFEYAF